MTGFAASAMSREDAEEFTQAHEQQLAGGWRLHEWAKRQGIPQALGLSLPEWVERVGGYAKLSVPERREAVKQLTSPVEHGGNGLSTREAAEVLGVDNVTVWHDQKAVDNSTPEPLPPTQSEPVAVDNSTPEPDSPPVPEPTPLPTPPPAEPKESRPHVAENSGDNEWYTPAEYIEAAVQTMGAIDLDPASSIEANSIVKATAFYTAADDGLTRSWDGRVWMNPPYASPLIEKFATRLSRSYKDGAVTQACVLVNNATETKWFQALAMASSAMCFPHGRVVFWHPRKISAPLQGQAVLYLGPDPVKFRRAFVRFGFVVTHAE